MSLKKPKAVIPDLTSEASLGFFRSGILVIGVDEVGRGCLAGPVVAGAAALNPENLLALGFKRSGARPVSTSDHPLLQVRDSKLIPESARARLLEKLACEVWAAEVAEASVGEIETLNILHASLLAMERAVKAVEEKLSRRADVVLIDGNRVPKGLMERGHAIIKGDQKSITIATASVFAKVYRDRLMDQYDLTYPGYGLKKHKGYPTPYHKAQIQALGATQIHRAGFKGVQ